MQIARCARDLELLALSRQCLERCLALDPDDVLALETLLDVLVDCADEYAYRRAFTYASALQQRLWRPTNFGSLSAVVPRLDDIDVGDLRFSKRRRVDMEEVEPAMLAPLDIVWDVDNDDLATWDAFIEFVVEQLELLAGKGMLLAVGSMTHSSMTSRVRVYPGGIVGNSCSNCHAVH